MAPSFTSSICLALCLAFSPLASAIPTKSVDAMAPAATCVSHYVVQSDDNCMKIANMHPDMGGINQLYAWNPHIHRETCENLGVNDKICVKMQPVSQCPPAPPADPCSSMQTTPTPNK